MLYLSHFLSPRGIRIPDGDQGRILRNQVTPYAHFLPTPSAYSFTYSTISVFVSLTDPESNGLNFYSVDVYFDMEVSGTMLSASVPNSISGTNIRFFE
jgi:hypothetical protein